MKSDICSSDSSHPENRGNKKPVKEKMLWKRLRDLRKL